MRSALFRMVRRPVPMLCFVLAAWSAASRADFPDPAQLPVHEGLPDPLVMLDGAAVSTKEQWFANRRPELRSLFEYYMYGQMPPAPKTIESVVEREDRSYFGGKATKREIAIGFGPAGTPKLHLLLVIPNERIRPAPVFVGANFCGNHVLLKDPSIALPESWMPARCPGCGENRATDVGRGSQVDVWAIEEVVGRGYAVATFYSGDVTPDHPGFRDGVHPHYFKPGQTEPGPHEWGAVASWAWGIHRAVDYLRTDGDLDATKIAVVGHSRLGKAALLAGAFDDRIALVISHQAGCGGSAPSRGKVGESVKRINTAFPFWFAGAFKAFNDQPERLPFDQHELVALAAPRPVLLTNAVEDTWANPEGQFQVLRAADPVYRLLGVEGLGASKMPEVGTLVDSKLGYHIRPGKHSMGREDWAVFLEFADKHFGKPAAGK